jgi:hypothetical protein
MASKRRESGRHVVRGVYQHCSDEHLARYLLTGREDLRESDAGLRMPRFQEDNLPRNLELVTGLRRLTAAVSSSRSPSRSRKHPIDRAFGALSFRSCYAPAASEGTLPACAVLYRHKPTAIATTVRPATMIAHGSAPNRSNHCV